MPSSPLKKQTETIADVFERDMARHEQKQPLVLEERPGKSRPFFNAKMYASVPDLKQALFDETNNDYPRISALDMAQVPYENRPSQFELGQHPGAALCNRYSSRFYMPKKIEGSVFRSASLPSHKGSEMQGYKTKLQGLLDLHTKQAKDLRESEAEAKKLAKVEAIVLKRSQNAVSNQSKLDRREPFVIGMNTEDLLPLRKPDPHESITGGVVDYQLYGIFGCKRIAGESRPKKRAKHATFMEGTSSTPNLHDGDVAGLSTRPPSTQNGAANSTAASSNARAQSSALHGSASAPDLKASPRTRMLKQKQPYDVDDRAEWQGGWDSAPGRLFKPKPWHQLSLKEKKTRSKLWKKVTHSQKAAGEEMLRSTTGFIKKETLDEAAKRKDWMNPDPFKQSFFYYTTNTKFV